ncbi:transient receptor potential channel pyrexia [Scomber japonicus]|uniref:transient receptor potential channel pyrexia n=1 Tax=Scomber japonicus TaxID=13676 RepID=UPI00230574B3|nr:transient receptor potential channel pyrexia [Scomber japonicus]
MKRATRVGLTGLQNPGLELEMTGNTSTDQVSLRSNQNQNQKHRAGPSSSSSGPSTSSGPSSSSLGAQVPGDFSSEGCSSVEAEKKKIDGYNGLAEDEEDEEQRDETDNSNKNVELSKKLLDHFRRLAASNQDSDQVDFQFVDQLISDGADPNSSDRYGQTVLHEISRAWSVDVMRFFLDRGSDLMRSDQFGVTPLHVASALDYQDMVQLLLLRKGLSLTLIQQDKQTPLHYAAKNDAVSSIRLLLQAGASVSCTDYKLRTPLQLAANLERSEAARVLLELGAQAGIQDCDGQLCITALIGRMSPVDWWRVLLVVLALLLTLEEVVREVQDIRRSRKKLRLWQQWAELRVRDDLRCSHPMWPQEKVFLLDQREKIQKMRGGYSQDLWNIFDWLVYTLLAMAFGVHVADVLHPSASLRTDSLRLFSVTIIFLWLRLMKHVRAFRLMGPFIVMLGKIVGDVMRFLFLYAEIFIPYACAFWIIFGGVFPSMHSVSGLLYSLYRITLVDEYEYDAMVTVDSVMAPLLCGTFLAASSILCVNLMIALVTDTFQRVYDNSQANAVMQQAAVILQVEESITSTASVRRWPTPTTAVMS